jgi:hypothetical protein
MEALSLQVQRQYESVRQPQPAPSGEKYPCLSRLMGRERIAQLTRG